MKQVVLSLLFFCIAQCLCAATYAVDNLGDTDNAAAYTAADGTNTLRKCIRLANANAGADIINFSLAGTITLTGNLPALTDNSGVTINGNTAPGYAANTNLTGALNGTLVVTINGANICTKGITISSDNNTIRGLNIRNTGTAGGATDACIDITSNDDNNKIYGCYLGTTLAGTGSSSANTEYGVRITSAANNKIGDGITAAHRNLISGMKTTGTGIYITGPGNWGGNTIKGNIIGLQKDGALALATTQQYGVSIDGDAVSDIIGGAVAGEGNVISGNLNSGIYFTSNLSFNHSVLGNIIGPQADGLSNVAANTQSYGMQLLNYSNTIIGGSIPGARNIISANLLCGIVLGSPLGNLVQGNYIGLDITGTSFIAGSSQDYGIQIQSGNNTIGGTADGEENVISGNTLYGIFSSTGVVSGSTIIGNIIGPRENGTTNVTSNAQQYGIYISGSPNITIGGSTFGAGNIISANLDYGIYITGMNATGNSIKGNYIGLNITGTAFIANSSQDYGVGIISSAASNTIGGAIGGEENVISGNVMYGVYFNSAGSSPSGNSVLGNIIGPQVDGTSNVTSNAQTHGVYISASPGIILGSNAAGAGNIISANLDYGVFITGAGSTANLIRGNYLGLDITGTTFIAGSSQDYGLNIENSAASNTIGGTGQGNVISGNTSGGAAVTSSAVAGNTFLGNIIGPLANGTGYVTSSNQVSGIFISGSPNNIIGGSAAGAGNIISANTTYGIQITGAGSTGNLIKGNYIGIDNTGTAIILGSNQDRGVYITSSAGSNTIGGTAAGEGNLISGNSSTGVYTNSAAAAGNTVLGNTIGPQADRISYVLTNAQTVGVTIIDSPNNIIGGSAPGAKNIISANLTYGILISGATSTGNLIKGNYIGPGSTLANIASSDQDYGVRIQSSPANNTIGGSMAGDANTIAFNTVNGIYILNALSTGNLISRNPIYTNTVKQINLNYGASQGNNGKAVPVITTVTTANIAGTSVAGDIVEVFKNTGGNCNDAVTFVGSATADGSGNWSLAVALADGDYVLATASDAGNNTSEFTPCVYPLPVTWLYFNAAAETNSAVKCQWATGTETNNDYFAVERSLSPSGGGVGGGDWKQIGTVKGAGNSSTTLRYEFIDEAPLSSGRGAGGEVYYRLRQVDYNGQYAYSAIRQVTISTSQSFSVYPTLSSGDFTVSFSEQKGKEILLVIRNILGQEFYSKEFIIDNDLFIESVNLSGKLVPGIYTIIAASDDCVFGKKIAIK